MFRCDIGGAVTKRHLPTFLEVGNTSKFEGGRKGEAKMEQCLEGVLFSSLRNLLNKRWTGYMVRWMMSILF